MSRAHLLEYNLAGFDISQFLTDDQLQMVRVIQELFLDLKIFDFFSLFDDLPSKAVFEIGGFVELVKP